MPISTYLDLIPPMNREKTRFISFLSAILSQVSDLDDLRLEMLSAFSLSTAEGAQLDIIGRLAGASRELPFEPASGSRSLADEDFRLLIRARILQDHWDGSNAGLITILQTLFPGSDVTVSDEQDMTISVTPASDISAIRLEMLEHGLLIPAPPGIALVVSDV